MVSLANAAAKRAARFDYSLSFLQAISPPSILGVKTHTLSLGVEILQPYKADIEAISRSSERLVLQLRHKAGGAIAVLVLAMGIATACSNGGDVETNVIETAPATLATPTPPITLRHPQRLRPSLRHSLWRSLARLHSCPAATVTAKYT